MECRCEEGGFGEDDWNGKCGEGGCGCGEVGVDVRRCVGRSVWVLGGDCGC